MRYSHQRMAVGGNDGKHDNLNTTYVQYSYATSVLYCMHYCSDKVTSRCRFPPTALYAGDAYMSPGSHLPHPHSWFSKRQLKRSAHKTLNNSVGSTLRGTSNDVWKTVVN